MIAHLYQNLILKNSKSVFVLLIIAILSFGYYSKDFRLDASSETLLIDGDPDLKYLQEISKRYGSKEFLILTYGTNYTMPTNSLDTILDLLLGESKDLAFVITNDPFFSKKLSYHFDTQLGEGFVTKK